MTSQNKVGENCSTVSRSKTPKKELLPYFGYFFVVLDPMLQKPNATVENPEIHTFCGEFSIETNQGIEHRDRATRNHYSFDFAPLN